ncbi:MAG: 50S ribosomal protein L15 [Deltaproteobacteria bacterium]|jgi:large subunit ribosomal protein L15|nr:50S ribosomal protein L15 [Deltaproteobacteria bacterium]MBW2696680.1 50S ribosomal protein L15 [Deltaproteobacteria bacterium]
MLDRLSPRPGAKHRRRRVGRGPGSGLGKTTGTGVKGQGTRSGKKIKAWFEGGQMPLTQRVPKRGFKNPFRKEVEIVNVGELAKLGDGASIDAEALANHGLIRGSGRPVKLLGEGEAPKNLTVKVHRVSASARAKVEAAGGRVELI